MYKRQDVNHAGSGIGLALAKAFVELHGGEITVDSVEGKGTVFTVDIPMTPVSYTHLDVYKRQVLVHRPWLVRRAFVEGLQTNLRALVYGSFRK